MHRGIEIEFFERFNSQEGIKIIESFIKACKKSLLDAVVHAGSGHVGGSLSSLDFLACVYLRASMTGEKVIISNGHVSAGVYAILGELGYISKETFLKHFRAGKSLFSGQVSALIPGIEYTTGPLGCGVSVACGIALAQKKKGSGKNVFVSMGDGEIQEGQVYEMVNFADKYKLDNLIVFIDYNKIQLSGKLDTIMDIDFRALFGHWNIHEIDGHSVDQIIETLKKCEQEKGKAHVIFGHTIMGKGVKELEKEGLNFASTWHGKAPNYELVASDLESLSPTLEDRQNIDIILSYKQQVFENHKRFENIGQKIRNNFQQIEGIILPELSFYTSGDKIACREAYSSALEKLISLNQEKIVLLIADVASSMGLENISKNIVQNFYECGIAEQNMVSVAGGMSVSNIIPFVSAYSNFCARRAGDQMRLNDINMTNVKMVCSHAGLSVGPDGPTHHALDDVASVLSLHNTFLIEPADANMMLHITHYIAQRYGNFYVRMGKHALGIITSQNGQPYYGKDYMYEYGKTDVICEGNEVTLIAIGSVCTQAFEAVQILQSQGKSIEFLIVSHYKDFDERIAQSIQKTGKLIVAEDCFTDSGLAFALKSYLFDHQIVLSKDCFVSLGPKDYFFMADSWENMYADCGMSTLGIVECVERLLKI